MTDDDLLDVGREAGLPIQEETKHVGVCARDGCENELPDDGPKTMNFGVDSGYCGLNCMLEAEEEEGDR